MPQPLLLTIYCIDRTSQGVLSNVLNIDKTTTARVIKRLADAEEKQETIDISAYHGLYRE